MTVRCVKYAFHIVKKFSLHCGTATTEGFVQNGRPGGRGGWAGGREVVGEGCLRDARGGVVAHGGMVWEICRQLPS